MSHNAAPGADGGELITYKCNNVSIHEVHNQQFELNLTTGELVNKESGYCIFGTKCSATAGNGCSGTFRALPCKSGGAAANWGFWKATPYPGSTGSNRQDQDNAVVELSVAKAASDSATVQRHPGSSSGGDGGVMPAISSSVCMEWGSSSGNSFISQAYTMVERLRPMLADIAGDAVIVGCFGWLLDLVTEWTGESSQPYPFVNHDAPQWSGSNASYADVRDLVTAIKLAGARCNLPSLKVGSLHVGWSHLYDIPAGQYQTTKSPNPACS